VTRGTEVTIKGSSDGQNQNSNLRITKFSNGATAAATAAATATA
jgi:hypothetical protein